MECRPLEITMVSAKDLKNVNFLTKMDVYAVASIEGDPFGATQKQKTRLHKHSGPNPTWNFPMKFTIHLHSLQLDRLFLKIQLKSRRAFGDREAGQVLVPLKQLEDSCDEKSQFRETTYSVRTPSGKSKGTLSLLFKFGEKFDAPAQEKAKTPEEPVMAYPVPQYGAYNQQPPYQQQYGAYNQQPPYQPQYGAYPPAGYGYPAQPGYGYQPAQKPKKNRSGMALGLGAGFLGGLLVGDMISDAGEMASYDAGYDAGFDDAFGF